MNTATPYLDTSGKMELLLEHFVFGPDDSSAFQTDIDLLEVLVR